ncbi:MAG: selenide, water dikinase SelD [Candidatus Eisenbacteria bacterium]|nr:selenide, water dikinase SelD [Candidatus Eisenbacteria bacterium]
MKPIYLDYNATTPIAPEAADAMIPYIREHFGNPSSGHPFGALAKRAVEQARADVAALLGADPGEIVFTGGGTESNNLALLGGALARRDRGRHVITSTIEHPAVTEVCAELEKRGFRVTRLAVDERGFLHPDRLREAIDDDTILVTFMLANNEVGTILPVRELAEIAHERGALVHTDAAQAMGKIPVRVDDLGVDLLSVAGHKLYAPKGVGALYIRSGARIEKILHGADHERGLRPGTENVPEIVGLGAACRVAGERLEEHMSAMIRARDRLHEAILREVGEKNVRMNGHPVHRLPNTLSLSFRGVEADTLLTEIGDRVAASAGAACHTEEVDISPVLQAMGVPVEWAMGTVRLTTGRGTTDDDVDRAAKIIGEAVRRLLPEGEGAPVSAASGENADVRLTQYTHGLGCACKLRPQDLEKVLRNLPRPEDPNLLVGADKSDDAAVYRVSDELAIVQTVDFFTPVVDDPYRFGAASAANSLSDVYAMGARPVFALNVVGFPAGRLPLRVLERILEGAFDKAREAGVIIAGGHTVDDTEPKFGLAVTGFVHPDRLVRNDGARAGDALVLTKPIGVGVLATAVKRGLAEEGTAEKIADLMAELNRAAAEAMEAIGASACTDVTGFGLLGHLHEMTAGSGVDAEIRASAVPRLEEALRWIAAGVVPGGTENNLEFVLPHVDFDADVPEGERVLLADAQTSGGLLIALPEKKAGALLEDLRKRGVREAALIGRFTAKGTGRIRVAR